MIMFLTIVLRKWLSHIKPGINADVDQFDMLVF